MPKNERIADSSQLNRATVNHTIRKYELAIDNKQILWYIVKPQKIKIYFTF